ncbi:MAG: hypothetical protein KC708_00105 [Anaerolineae bacterium]|nr:hypothetical protein [Anaerolineae bacterium]
MSRFLEAWDQLLDSALDADYDEQQMALFQIGLIFERHNPALAGDQEIYDEELSRELQRLMLSKDRLTDAINMLLGWAANNRLPADACLYAVSRADSLIYLQPFLEFLRKQGTRLKDDAAYQAVQILDTCARNHADRIAQVAPADLSQLLEQWQDSEDDLLADKAAFVAKRLQNILGSA